MLALTPAEKRLAALLFALALLGSLARGARRLSPEVAAWMDGPAAAPEAPAEAPAVEERAESVPTGPIDPNRATPEELRSLRGIGPALAARIVEDRARGPYRRPADLLRVRGIGPATLARIGPRLVFGDTSSHIGTPAPDSAGMGQVAP